jgi:hypothetical protein
LARRLSLVLLGLAVVAITGTTVYQRSFAQGFITRPARYE